MLTELRNAKLRPDGRAACSPLWTWERRGATRACTAGFFCSRCSRCSPCAGCGTGPRGDASRSLLHPESGLLGLGTQPRCNPGSGGGAARVPSVPACRSSSLPSVLAGKPRVAPSSSFFVPLEVSHALRAVPPGSARTGPSGGAARRGAEALPGRGSRQRALLFRQRQGARLCPAAAGCGPARALSAPNRTSAQSGAGFSIPSDFLSFFSFLFPPFLFSVN